ncbi:MAG: ABC transporter substrate-binding protein [Devosia sp.]|uniref:ABC transporter substrate-binding protein n=1 Tax=Devosia sp. TaxID=1871048 RepID=UPI0033973A48
MIKPIAVALAFVMMAALPLAAQETRPFTHDTGTTEIPVAPKRIVTLHDVGLTIPLLELGVPPIASSGRMRADGSIYLRSGMSLVGVDFDNSDITYVDEEDFEAISAITPDLIITSSSDEAMLRQYNLIAPTITLDRFNRTGTDQFRVLADAVGATDEFNALESRLEWQIASLKQAVPNAGDITVSILHGGEDGGILSNFMPTYGSLGHVLAKVGFKMTPLAEELGVQATVSAERVPELDADFIIITYRNDQGDTPETARADMEAALPGWCDFLSACRNDQVLFLPRDEAFTVSYNAMDLAIATVHAGIAGRNFTPLAASE